MEPHEFYSMWHAASVIYVYCEPGFRKAFSRDTVQIITIQFYEGTVVAKTACFR